MTRGDYLGEFELVVLLALVRLKEAYGIAVYDEIVAATGRDVSVQAVYVTLNRLERKGYVTARVLESPKSSGGRTRKHYAVLPGGVAALGASREMYDRLWAGVSLKSLRAGHEAPG